MRWEVAGCSPKQTCTADALNEEDKRTASMIAPHVRVLKMGMCAAPQYAEASDAVAQRCIYVASDARENLFGVMWLLEVRLAPSPGCPQFRLFGHLRRHL